MIKDANELNGMGGWKEKWKRWKRHDETAVTQRAENRHIGEWW